jgi:hypothetical protein
MSCGRWLSRLTAAFVASRGVSRSAFSVVLAVTGLLASVVFPLPVRRGAVHARTWFGGAVHARTSFGAALVLVSPLAGADTDAGCFSSHTGRPLGTPVPHWMPGLLDDSCAESESFTVAADMAGGSDAIVDGFQFETKATLARVVSSERTLLDTQIDSQTLHLRGPPSSCARRLVISDGEFARI